MLPLAVGAAQLRSTCWLPGVAAKVLGTAGSTFGVAFTVLVLVLSPMLLTAATW